MRQKKESWIIYMNLLNQGLQISITYLGCKM